ncbi:MAG TPA: Gfo/Idh/MocA family oxidoreductase [Terriglobales bacterium]|nr:Gfo/Idh/MocA family oxidoreductase [Terriglobales bacterium]
MPKQKLHLAMIGSGFIGKVHSNAFRQVGHFFDLPYDLLLKVICGRNPEKLEAAAAQWGWDETETDWQTVVARKDIDVVDVAVPNALHAPIAIAAAQAGKAVLCEKPLAVSLEEAKSMAQAVHHVPNLVWFNYRRLPAVAFAKQLIEEGRIGQTFHYRALYLNQSGNDPSKASGWRYKRNEAGSGAAGDLLSHLIDLALYLNGPLSELNAMTHIFAPERDVDDAALMLTRFANGSIGTFEVSRYGVGCQNRNTFEINGSKGMLRFTLDDMNRLDFFDAQEASNLQGMRSITVTGPDHPYWQSFWKPGHAIGYEHPFIATLGDFLLAWARQEPFHVNFDDAVAVQRVLDAVERSAVSQSWVKLDP